MIMHTHRMVARHLYLGLEREEQKQLIYRTFVWSNVKPDLLPEYKRISHYYPANEDFVFNLLEKVCLEDLSPYEFTETLGILIHFLCDYACTYHANMAVNQANSMRQHMQYEFLLHGYTIRTLKKTQIKYMPLKTIEEAKEYILSIIARVDLVGMIPDMRADFYAMLEISASILKFALKQSPNQKITIN